MADTHGDKGEAWIGFDLDGTLAEYTGWKGVEHIGKPVMPMVQLITRFRASGRLVKIVTARVAPRNDDADIVKARKVVEEWCERNLGFIPEITHEKDSRMIALYDDRVIQVEKNTGRILGGDFISREQDERDAKYKSLCEEFMVRWRCDGYDDAVRTLEGEFAAIGRTIPY